MTRDLTPALDEVLSATELPRPRRRVAPLAVHPESLIGADISTPGCACDVERIIAQVCIDAGGCVRAPVVSVFHV